MVLSFLRSFSFLAVISAFSAIVYFNVYTVKADHIGLLKEQTLGYQKQILEPGYHWLWTGFIPQKWTLLTINTRPPVLRVNYEQSLRYSEYLNLSDTFNVKLSLDIRYILPRERIFELMNLLDHRSSDINVFIEERIQTQLDRLFYEIYRTENDINRIRPEITQYFQVTDPADSPFVNDWQRLFTHNGSLLVNLEKWNLRDIYVPDPVVYREQTRNINRIFEARRRAAVAKIYSEADVYHKKLQNQAELSKSREYSELLRNNPSILDYLKIERLNPEADVILYDTDKGNATVNVNSGGKAAPENETTTTEQKTTGPETGRVIIEEGRLPALER